MIKRSNCELFWPVLCLLEITVTKAATDFLSGWILFKEMMPIVIQIMYKRETV